MNSTTRQVSDFYRARRLWLLARREKSDESLCYRCLRPRECLYPMQLPGFMFAYDGESKGAPTNIWICADCLRDVCSRLTKWVLNP